MKILSKIQNKVKIIKKNNKTVGLCHGVFDIIHFGHLKHFEAAKKKCDFLFVSITSEQYINKGPNRPVHSDVERLFFLNNLSFIDYAFIAEGDSAIDSINLVKPDYYFKGNDYKDNFSDKTKKIFKEINAEKKIREKLFIQMKKK